MKRKRDEVLTGRPIAITRDADIPKPWEQRLIDDCNASTRDGLKSIRDCHRIAARILSGDDGRPELLHLGIILCLNEIDDLCRADGGELHSRQVIAAFLFAWRNANPGARPYGA